MKHEVIVNGTKVRVKGKTVGKLLRRALRATGNVDAENPTNWQMYSNDGVPLSEDTGAPSLRTTLFASLKAGVGG